jgi:bifunctional pyridoxal-dependent enzyme with beta-cystathionase and maltose regulon repressor activities
MEMGKKEDSQLIRGKSMSEDVTVRIPKAIVDEIKKQLWFTIYGYKDFEEFVLKAIMLLKRQHDREILPKKYSDIS